MLVSMGSAIVLLVGLVFATSVHPITMAVAMLFLLCIVLFHSLTVEVTDRTVRLRFGVGLIGKSFPIAAIRRARVVRNPWYYGWGIRWFPGGWLFNVSGLDAVELTMRDRRVYRIGTDEPEKLLSAIESVVIDGHSCTPTSR